MKPNSNHFCCPLTQLLYTFTLVICISSCTTTIAQSGDNAKKNESISKESAGAEKSGRVNYIFRDSVFVEGKLDRNIEPIGGFGNVISQTIRYPARARESGVQGTVWITVVVDEFGRVVEYGLKKGIGAGCDEEALRAMAYVREIGFDPPLQNGIPVKVKFDVPFKFMLP